MSDPLDYAVRCARANPSKANAVMCLRNLVEGDHWPHKVALGFVMQAFPIGLNDIADIATQANARYGKGVAHG